MFDQEDGELNIALGVLFGVIALVIFLVIGLAIYKTNYRTGVEPEGTTEVLDARAMEAYSDLEPEGDALIRAYFAPGRANLPGGFADVLEGVLAALEQDPAAVVLISGFYDNSGDQENNAVLARDRAMAARQALIDVGISSARIQLRAPAEVMGSEDAIEARRVEIRVQ